MRASVRARALSVPFKRSMGSARLLTLTVPLASASANGKYWNRSIHMVLLSKNQYLNIAVIFIHLIRLPILRDFPFVLFVFLKTFQPFFSGKVSVFSFLISQAVISKKICYSSSDFNKRTNASLQKVS